MNERLLEEIEYINDIELDILWTLLKRKDLGISRKLVCMGFVLEISEKTILAQAERDENDRILDKANRMCIHDALIKHDNRI